MVYFSYSNEIKFKVNLEYEQLLLDYNLIDLSNLVNLSFRSQYLKKQNSFFNEKETSDNNIKQVNIPSYNNSIYNIISKEREKV